jgi:hypothetical protein
MFYFIFFRLLEKRGGEMEIKLTDAKFGGILCLYILICVKIVVKDLIY